MISRSTRDRISIRTPLRRSPSPSTTPAASVPIGTSDNYCQKGFSEYVRLVDASASFEGLLPDLDFGGDINVNTEGGDINVNTEDDFGDLAAMTAQATPPLEIFDRICEGASGDIVEDIGLHIPGQMAKLQT